MVYTHHGRRPLPSPLVQTLFASSSGSVGHSGQPSRRNLHLRFGLGCHDRAQGRPRAPRRRCRTHFMSCNRQPTTARSCRGRKRGPRLPHQLARSFFATTPSSTNVRIDMWPFTTTSRVQPTAWRMMLVGAGIRPTTLYSHISTMHIHRHCHGRCFPCPPPRSRR